MNYLLDTNICVYLLNNSSTACTQHLAVLPRQSVFLCSVVRGELLFGAWKSIRKQGNLIRFREFLEEFPTKDFENLAADHYADIRYVLERNGTPIGEADLMIAAIARAHGLTLVTNNLREFSCVPSLLVEDWTA